LDYYNVLRVGHNASRKDIEKAYERLVKESRYDSSIDRSAIETAYRVLSDIATKAQYDSRQTLKTKRQARANKRTSRFNFHAILNWLTLQHLLWILGVTVMIMAMFYWSRYGYVLQEFHAGDVLFERTTKSKYGRILRVDSQHHFGNTVEKAYQIQMDTSQVVIGSSDRVVWVPQDTVKALCYKP
jgi:curved DNA-binding protein CbpA